MQNSIIELPERFELDREIGRGGMAVVYRAHDNHLGRFVAIKVLSADLSNTVGTERFQREIALMAKLVHPGIVALFDSGEANGRLYYVMPLVVGETLRARLTRERRVAPPEAAALGADIAEALAYAHGVGIVHRDVKPENIFAVAGRAVLADFGIARVSGDRTKGGQLTTGGMLLGTLSYISPEQAGGEDRIEGRSDLYSLGCVLYELMTGAPPFVAPTALALIGKHMSETPRPLSEHGVMLSRDLEAVVLQCLAKDPEQRPANAGAVARLLRAASHVRPPVHLTASNSSAPSATPTAESVVISAIRFADGDTDCAMLASALQHAVAGSLRTLPGMRVVTESSSVNTAIEQQAGAEQNTSRRNADALLTSGQLPTDFMATRLIDGHVRRSVDRVRVTMRITDAQGNVQWSENIDGTFADVFSLEDQVCENITAQFRTLQQPGQSFSSLTTNRGAPPAGQLDTRSRIVREADTLVTEGIRAFKAFGPSGGAAAKTHLEEAKVYYTRALALDPHNARGLCALGNWYYVAAVVGVGSSEEALARGRELIFAALAADDQIAEVHCSMGKIALYYDDDFHAASRHIRRALDLQPSDTEALRLISIVYKILGRAEDAVNAARAATERAPELAPLWNALADALLAAGQNAEATDALRRAINLLPGYRPALERLELARARLGEHELAVEIRSSRIRLAGQRERADKLDDDTRTLGASRAIKADVRRELDELLLQAATTDPFLNHVGRTVADRIVAAHAELGEWSEAMNWVERAYEWRPGRLRRMLADLPTDYRGLAVDPRYARLLRVAGMEDMM